MKSMNATQSRHQFIITDLDQSDTQEMGAAAATTSAGLGNEKQCKTHKRRIKDKTLHTLSGNFSRRSQSVECCVQERLADKPPQRTSKVTNYFNELVKKLEILNKILIDSFIFVFLPAAIEGSANGKIIRAFRYFA